MASRPPGRREVSGTLLVFVLLGFGITLTTIMFVYFETKSRPFRSLTEAVGREFPKSLPKIEGGRDLKADSITVLRIAMRVSFKPDPQSIETQRQINRVTELARESGRLAEYDRFDVHLLQFLPEKTALVESFSFRTADLKDVVPFPAAAGP